MSVLALARQLGRQFKLPINTQGQLLSVTDRQFTTTPLARRVAFVETDDQLNAELTKGEDFKTIFYNWTRISRQGFPTTDQDVPEELTSWTYNEDDGTINSTINSTSLIGFISPIYVEDYVFEVELSSQGGDDDAIGLVLAYAYDPVAKTTHTLTVFRVFNWYAPLMVNIDYDYPADNTKPPFIALYGGLHWVDGTEATGPMESGNQHGFWSDLTQPIKLRVTRRGNDFTIEASDVNQTEYLPSATTSFTLDEDPRLAVFKGPQRFGYAAISQDQATFKTLSRPGLYDPIVDLRDYTYYTFDPLAQSWTSTPSTYQDLLDTNRLGLNELHYSPSYGRFYYAGNDALRSLS